MNHHELAQDLREVVKSSSVTLRQLEQDTGVSRSYLCAFTNGQTVCFDILNRLANYFDYEYQITNSDSIEYPDVYIDNIINLVRYLRDQLWATSSVMAVSKGSGLAKSRLYEFRKGDAICLMKMDALCEYYKIMYKIKNHPEELTHDLEWAA